MIMTHMYVGLWDTFKSEIGANTRLDSASATVILAPAAGQRRPLIGCSPIEVADPVWKSWHNYDQLYTYIIRTCAYVYMHM